jgi:hypothetical protein
VAWSSPSWNRDLKNSSSLPTHTKYAIHLSIAADIIIEFDAYRPPGVTEILATSFDYYISRIDYEIVLKYLHKKPSPDIEVQENLAVEAQIYNILGHHHRIISFKGGNALQGLRLKFATNGLVA